VSKASSLANVGPAVSGGLAAALKPRVADRWG
jgi:hypothetical protein